MKGESALDHQAPTQTREYQNPVHFNRRGELDIMRAKITAFLGITILILVISALSTSTAFAMGATSHNTNVLDLKGNDVGDATLIVSKGTLTVNVHTTELEARHVISVWGKINGGDSFHLAGHMSGGDGSMHFAGKAKLGSNTDLSKFEVILHDHGDPIAGQVDEQRSTKKTGCVENDPPGPNTNCILPVQTATFVIS